jgi:two-component system response regulator AtoC
MGRDIYHLVDKDGYPNAEESLQRTVRGKIMGLARTDEVTEIADLPPIEAIFGQTSMMRLIHEKMHRVANTTVPVLLQGESGTGKEVLARYLHAISDRSMFPFVKVMCPAIPHSLIESELFGYERGAFTGASATKRGRMEQAHRGTLFLDEVGSLEAGVQAKLLQVLQDGSFMRVGGQEEKSVDTRLVCAANGDLRQQTEDGTFRLDFLFRINAVTIDLPPLRQRTMDIPLLIDHFLNHYAEVFQMTPKPLSREVSRMLQRYDWPGNIRQLENMIRSYVLVGIEELMIPDIAPAAPTKAIPEIDLVRPISLKESTKSATRELEREIIRNALKAHGWNRQKTAKWLNISYRALLYKLQEYNVVGIGVPQGQMLQDEPVKSNLIQ